MMLGWIGSLLGGGLLRQLDDLLKRQQDATTEREKARLQAQVDVVQARLAAQTQGDATWLPKIVQALFAVPFVIYLWKLIVWDKVLGWGVTDGLGAYETTLSGIVVGFYFLTTGAQSVARTIWRR